MVPGRHNLIADLRELFDAVRKDYRIRERAANAPMPVVRVASILALQPGIGSSLIAATMRLERSTVSNVLRDMRGRKLIRRKRLRGDGRYVSIELTARGHALVLRAGRAGNGLLVRAVDRMASGEARRLSLAIGPLLLAVRGDRPVGARSGSVRGAGIVAKRAHRPARSISAGAGRGIRTHALPVE